MSRPSTISKNTNIISYCKCLDKYHMENTMKKKLRMNERCEKESEELWEKCKQSISGLGSVIIL